MKEQIKKTIQQAIAKLYPAHGDVVFAVDYAPESTGADYASNAAMALAKKLGKKPMEVAEEIKSYLSAPSGHLPSQGENNMKITVAVPGFLNFNLPAKAFIDELSRILKEGSQYGTSNINKGKKARVEYVSANPTGPIHIGNVRGGPYGETISKILEATGYKVLREYIHNDIGGQVEKLGKTVWYWYEKLTGQESVFPEGGYQGEYLQEVVGVGIAKLGKGLDEKDMSKLTAFALNYIFEENIEVLTRLGIKFDLIVNESELASSGKTAAAIDHVKSAGFAKEHEGALWFVPNDEFLTDREAVIVKSNGQPTYFASDIAYHKEKFESGYDLVMDVFGSNHHGHVPKLQALTKIFGFDPARFVVLLYQYVRLKRGQEVVKMAKRAGTYVTAKEVLDEVGKNSMIFMLLMTAVNTHVDFDLELAKDKSDKNPVFSVQYAHARINSIFEKAKSKEIKNADLGLLKEREELLLIRELSKYPELVMDISTSYNIHQIPHYLLSLSDRFHGFYEKVRVITEDEELSRARLALVRGVQIGLANGLRIIVIEPMEKM